ncbi:MAG: tetraacyldisaccharide 4'-kinase [Bacteroidales bacterium]|jgi:tetraacyldisaccharide 4'-kinase|nr:tetraacyldisaccharide 4'-kinase [Bacteroidales bacterium]
MSYQRSILLYPFSLLYGLVTSIRNFLYNAEILKSQEFSIPLICVGNLTIGGTGKTPHTEYLAELLKRSFSVVILSRGYKRKSSGFMFADANSKVSDIGDEPMQIFRKLPDITVAVDRNRVRGIEKILKEKPETEVIILDDGFQHRKITPGFSILLSDFDRLMIRDHLLPYGNLRESINNMDRADIILVTKSPEKISPIQRRLIVKEIHKAPYQNLYFTSITYKDPVPVFGNHLQEATPSFPDDSSSCGIVLVTGIANPKPFYEYLGKSFNEIIHLQFGDHHLFTLNDVNKISDAWASLRSQQKYVITTEKDAVRLQEFTNFAEPVKSSFYYIPVGTKFLNDDQDEFDNLIVDYVRKNKRNNRVS